MREALPSAPSTNPGSIDFTGFFACKLLHEGDDFESVHVCTAGYAAGHRPGSRNGSLIRSSHSLAVDAGEDHPDHCTGHRAFRIKLRLTHAVHQAVGVDVCNGIIIPAHVRYVSEVQIIVRLMFRILVGIFYFSLIDVIDHSPEGGLKFHRVILFLGKDVQADERYRLVVFGTYPRLYLQRH